MDRIMTWVFSIGDIPTIADLGCNVIHHPAFDGMPEAEQINWVNECKRLGLKVSWSALGGSEYAREHREETIKRWKDDPVVYAVIIVGDAQMVRKEDQIRKYNAFKSWAPNILFGIDRAFWFARNGYYSEDAFDILFFYSYPYLNDYSVDTAYERLIASMTYLIRGNFPMIPLIQCFSGGKHFNPKEKFGPGDYIKAQYDRLEALLSPKGWWSDSIAFYQWRGAESDVRRDPIMQTDIKRLNTGVTPSFPCPHCPAIFTSQADLDAHIASEHPTNGEITTNIVALEDCFSDREHPNLVQSIADIDCFAISGQDTRDGFVKFLLSSIPAGSTISSATLHMYCFTQRHNTVANVRECANNWSETTLCWNNQPASGASKGNFSVGTGWKNLSVTSYVQAQWAGDKVVSFKLVPTPITGEIWPGQEYRSSEYATDKPYLAVTYSAAPVEEITTKTILHTCNVKISYQVSSFPENNDPLTCPNCGMALGVEGIRGSEEIIEEEITTHIITCAKCGSQLKLTISVSIPEKNTEQYCPVCGEPAD